MSDWKTDDHRTGPGRGRDDQGRRDEPRGGPGREGRTFGPGGSRQDRLEGDDYGGMGTQGAESRHMDSGGGFQGEERFGHSGGIDSGYGGQSGKAGWGPLSQGSSYGQGGPEWGHSGWGGGGSRRSQGGQRDYGFRGQGGGGQQWAGERGSYGQGGGDPSAQRSRDRTTQYNPNDHEGFVAYGRAYGDAQGGGHEHDHEPGYRDWRDRQLSSHDADYGRWREEQARKYDEDYKTYRTSRHETFSKGFQSWRDQQAAPGAEAPTAASSATASATAGGGSFDVVGDNVRNVSDGGEGEPKRDDSAKH